MTKPCILLIDDEPQTASFGTDANLITLQPEDANFSADLVAAIPQADLILLDHNLHLGQDLTLLALDGASFVGHLRSYARANGLTLPPLVIYTSEDEAFREEVPSVGAAVPIDGSFVGRQARLAPKLDVEWLISKNGEEGATLALALANDARKLREISVDGRMSMEETAEYLQVPEDTPWRQVAHSSIARWRPPVSEPGASGPGPRGVSATLRWLLHQVLPFPGLLLSSEYAAWSIGVEIADFHLAAEGGRGELSNLLDNARYRGPGQSLYEPRWWAPGIDYASWQLRDLASSCGDRQSALDELAGPGLSILGTPEKVVVVNSDLEEPQLAELEDAVEINPPGWPSEALQPWMTRDEAQSDPKAQTMVDPADLELLK